MTTIELVLIVTIVMLFAAVVMLGILLRRPAEANLSPLMTRFEGLEKLLDRSERSVKDEIICNRREATEQAHQFREEVQRSLRHFSDSFVQTLERISDIQQKRLADFANQLKELEQSSNASAAQLRQELTNSLSTSKESQENRLSETRAELAANFRDFKDSLQQQMSESANLHKQYFDSFAAQLIALTEKSEQKSEELRSTVESKLTQLQTDNANKLEEMRRTVDEKLQGTLDKRLGESFKLVSDRLEQVHKGLGEMQTLASGVGDLKRVLTNVKTRGTWAEMQLANLLEQILTPDQYAANVRTKPTGHENVEFAIKLPGHDDNGKVVLLPIDAKFPKEDYERLVDAAEHGDADAAEHAAKNLEACVRSQARDIRDKYIAPPFTTDFALLYLPIEGLYAEVLRRPGLADSVQREYRIVITGPTTLAALLNSLQMGFRTLAIQKRSSEVWKVLSAVKAEFGKFGDMLDKVKQKLDETGNTIEDAVYRSRQLEKKLKKVEALPSAEAASLLAHVPSSDDETPDESL